VIVSAAKEYVDCTTCLSRCYKLINCANPEDVTIFSTMDDVLTQYIYQSIQVDFCPGKCFYVTDSDVCEGSVPFPDDVVITSYTDCNICLGKPPVDNLRTRSIKPGFYTPGCPPEYTVKTSCRYGEQVYDEMVAIRYGITICCDHDIDKWDIKKQLLELSALKDDSLCTAAACPENSDPCNVTATATGYEVYTYNPPAVPPCDPPQSPIIVNLEKAYFCYEFLITNFGVYPSYAYTYITYITIGDIVYDIQALVSAPIQAGGLFSYQFVNALASLGVTCSSAIYGPSPNPFIEGETLIIYNCDGQIVSLTTETRYLDPVYNEINIIEGFIVECTEPIQYPCYTSTQRIDFANPTICFYDNITIWNAETQTTEIYYIYGDGVVVPSSSQIAVPQLVTYLQSKGYDLTSASVLFDVGTFTSTLIINGWDNTKGSLVGVSNACQTLPPTPVDPPGNYFNIFDGECL
jgi:hypothetical protein